MKVPDHIAVPYIIETVVFLLAVVIIVPVFKKIRISPILGYLAIGASIGPHALGVVADVDDVQHFAELGVIFLLFTIGLELSFSRLKTFSRLIFGLGFAQVAVSAVVIGLVAFAWGHNPQAASIIGLCMALSSTAMVVHLLKESGEFASNYGRSSFAILLFQDLAVVPILILLSALGSTDGNLLSNILMSFLKAVAAVAIIVVVGRYILRYLFRMASRTRSVDVFTAMMLLVILTTSIATGFAGLSMALGAFLAGLLLAETEFRHQIEAEIEPFKGLFLGLFFVSVGMNLDFALAFKQGVWVILSVFGLVVIKAFITGVLCLMFRIRLADALRTGFVLSESGEFAFVVIGQATLTYSLINIEVGQFMVVVASLSMMLTPLLAGVGGFLAAKVESKESTLLLSENSVEGMHDHVIIAGFGRMGQSVAKVLGKQGIPFVGIDKDADAITAFHGQNLPVYVGDSTRQEIFKHACIENAAVLLVTLNDAAAVMKTVKMARKNWPVLKIVVRAYDDVHSQQLLAAGATEVVSEAMEASLQLSGHVLCSMGMSKEESFDCIREFVG